MTNLHLSAYSQGRPRGGAKGGNCTLLDFAFQYFCRTIFMRRVWYTDWRCTFQYLNFYRAKYDSTCWSSTSILQTDLPYNPCLASGFASPWKKSCGRPCIKLHVIGLGQTSSFSNGPQIWCPIEQWIRSPAGANEHKQALPELGLLNGPNSLPSSSSSFLIFAIWIIWVIVFCDWTLGRGDLHSVNSIVFCLFMQYLICIALILHCFELRSVNRCICFFH